ncbi:MAG: hypothetical protein JWP02_1610 [Acidimicrobiales bacterium]|jgi:hypothetical protein|nr:hypothetical protein [Acidimicrobiales bacterium]
MTSTWATPLGDVRAYSSRVGEAWRVLGPHALAYHRAELANDIDVLRQPLAMEETTKPRGWRVALLQRQQLRLLASTY